jgi:hypothetical protein
MNFKEWLIKESSNPGSKTGLYPLGYGGIGLYPPQWYTTRSPFESLQILATCGISIGV